MRYGVVCSVYHPPHGLSPDVRHPTPPLGSPCLTCSIMPLVVKNLCANRWCDRFRAICVGGACIVTGSVRYLPAPFRRPTPERPAGPWVGAAIPSHWAPLASPQELLLVKTRNRRMEQSKQKGEPFHTLVPGLPTSHPPSECLAISSCGALGRLQSHRPHPQAQEAAGLGSSCSCATSAAAIVTWRVTWSWSRRRVRQYGSPATLLHTSPSLPSTCISVHPYPPVLRPVSESSARDRVSRVMSAPQPKLKGRSAKRRSGVAPKAGVGLHGNGCALPEQSPGMGRRQACQQRAHPLIAACLPPTPFRCPRVVPPMHAATSGLETTGQPRPAPTTCRVRTSSSRRPSSG